MGAADVAELAKASLILLLTISAPMLIVSLVVGVVIGLLQALTQVQEMTLTFVPKIIVIFGAIILFMPFMMNAVIEFTRVLFDRIAVG